MSSLREVLSKESVSVFVRASLPGTVWITEVDLQACIEAQLDMLSQLGPAIPREASRQLGRQATNLPHKRFANRFSVFSRDLHQQRQARTAFDEGGDLSIAGTNEEIAFPMARHGTIGNFRRPLTNGDSVNDLSLSSRLSPS